MTEGYRRESVAMHNEIKKLAFWRVLVEGEMSGVCLTALFCDVLRQHCKMQSKHEERVPVNEDRM